jgi:hypothetical protein
MDMRSAEMTLKDKLELGIKDDAAFRKDNLPEDEVRGPEDPAGPGRSPVVREEKEEREAAREEAPEAPPATDDYDKE